MAGEERASKVAAGMSTSAAIMSALALFTGKAKAAGEEIPEELWNLIIAIAKSADNVDLDMDTLINEVKKISTGGGLGFPTNCNAIQTVAVVCTVANRAYQLPDMTVPDGFALFLKADPFLAAAAAIRIGEDQSAATNPNRSVPLVRGDTLWYFVDNANEVWISSSVANGILYVTSEKRKAV